MSTNQGHDERVMTHDRSALIAEASPVIGSLGPEWRVARVRAVVRTIKGIAFENGDVVIACTVNAIAVRVYSWRTRHAVVIALSDILWL